MKRVKEPELMDDKEQVMAYSDGDFSVSDNSFVAALSDFLVYSQKSLGKKSLLLDLGCGPGNISERLSGSWPESKVLGIDGSSQMIRVANARARNISIKDNILFYKCLKIQQLIDPAIELSGSANLLVSNSLLHHLHTPIDLWNAIKNLASPGAVVFIRDLRRPCSKDQAIAIQKKYLPKAANSDILVRDFLASLNAAFTIDEVRIQLEEVGLEGLLVSEYLDRYLEIKGIL